MHAHYKYVRDGETVYVSLNGRICWSMTGITTQEGTQQCGQGQPRNEKLYPVTGCSRKLSGWGDQALEIRVWTNLDGNPGEESFGIDNVYIYRTRDTAQQPTTTLSPRSE